VAGAAIEGEEMTAMEISTLIGKTLIRASVIRMDWMENAEEIVFETTDGEIFALLHLQDCCESVYVEDVCGDMEDLIGSPIMRAEEVSSIDGFNSDKPADEYQGYGYESYTWTFYKLATIRGSVTVRFYGTSNGYYSESVSFVQKDRVQ
jgi:hypothetical protein